MDTIVHSRRASCFRAAWTLAAMVAVVAVPKISVAGTLTSVAPSGATPGVTLQISGTGFSATAGENDVTFTPAAGTPQTVAASSVTILDPVTRRGRVGVTVPTGLPVGSVALRVTNRSTGEASEGRTLQVLGITLGTVRTAPADGSPVDLEIVGSANVTFVAGATGLVFGAGVTVQNVIVDAPNRLRAHISVASGATPGPRMLAFNTSQQLGIVPGALTVLAPSTNAPPVANVNGPYSGIVGQAIVFTSGGSNDPDNDPLTFQWTFGDGSSSTAANPAHTYAAAAVYDVLLMVQDNQGHSRTATTKATIGAAMNRPPVASAGGPYAGIVAQDVLFSGHGSADPDGDTLLFVWDFGDGSSGTGPAPAHTFLSPGSYAVSLLVSDAKGGTSTARTIARVTTTVTGNRPPLANIGGPYTVVAGQPLTLSASGSSDPDRDTLAFVWVLGDGATSTGVSPDHVYATASTYTVTVLVSDGRGGSDSASATVIVVAQAPPQNQSPVARAGPALSVRAAVTAELDGSASSDPDGDALTFAWSYGDGASGSGAHAQHAYVEPGTYTATLLVSDGKGGASTATTAVTVTNDPGNRSPTASIAGPSSGTAGSTISLQATGSDPDGDTLTYRWDFGDGANSSGGSASHVWSQAGIYAVALTISDGRGGTATAIKIVTVFPQATPNNAPVADAAGPYTGQQGSPIAFDSSASHDPDDDPLTYAWSFGDAETATGKAPAHTYALAGTYTVTLIVSDTHGGSSAATASVTVNGNTAINRPPVARLAGPYFTQAGVGVPFDASASSDPDGQPMTFVWDFGDQTPHDSGSSALHVYASAGEYTVTLTVIDSSGASDSVTASVTVASPADRAPPIVSLIVPKQVLPGARVTITAQAVDNVSISSVRFEIENDSPSETSTAPYQRTFTVPAFAAPGQTIKVRAVARDPSGNTGLAEALLTITAQPDTEAPVVALAAPLQTSPGSSMRLVATATDNVGVSSVTFLAGSSVVGTVQAPPFEASYTVPASANGVLSFTARAADASGNTGEGTANVVVAGTRDLSPPIVALSAPGTVPAGAKLHLAATASDDAGIASVTFYVDGVPVFTDTQSPYETDVTYPAGTPAGGVIVVAAKAVDFSDLSASDAKTILVTATAAPSLGVVTGVVYDDTTGLPLAGVAAVLAGVDALGSPYSAQTATDARGRYLLRGAAGDSVVHVSKNGWTPSDRRVAIAAGQTTRAFDARLTPLAAATQLSPLNEGSVGSATVHLTVPVGALGAPSPISVTAITQQGIQGLLPPGWVPVGAADVAPHGLVFTGRGSLRVPNGFGLPAGAQLTIAAWDEAAAAWRMIEATTIGGDATVLESTIASTGQFVWLLADSQPAPPPAGSPGALLAGVGMPGVPDAVTAVVSPNPNVLFYRPGVHSDVRGTIVATPGLSSGARLLARISERYTFVAGGQANPDPFEQDLVFYQLTSDPTTVAASYPVSPSLTFEALNLQQGVITVEHLVPPVVQGRQLVDLNGGIVTGPGGESLVLPAGAVAAATPFEVTTLGASQLGITLPPELSLAAAVQVMFDGALGAPAVLVVPKPQGYRNADASRVLLVRLQEVGGQTRFVLAGLSRIDGDTMVSDLSLAGQATGLEGIRAPGRYLFVRVADAVGPIGFAQGTVSGAAGAVLTSGLISTALPVVSLSRSDGSYFAAGKAGAATFNATDLVKLDIGSGNTTIVAGHAVPLDIAVVPQVPRVTSLTPASGAVDVPLSDPLIAEFSASIDIATVTGPGAINVKLAAEDGQTVTGTIALSANNTRLTFRPAVPLASNQRYAFTLTQSIKSPSGYGLDKEYRTTFTSIDTVAMPLPAAGLSATIPNAQGQTVVTGTRIAGSHDRIYILNVTKGTSTFVQPDPSGGFSVAIAAGMKDKLKIQIVGPSGNETVADIGLFRNPDGSVAIPPEGGSIDAANQLRLDVPAGAFPDGAIVKFTWLSSDQVPVPAPVGYPLVNAFEVSASVQPQKYLKVSMPAPPGSDPSTQGVVAEFVQIAGVNALSMVDTAKIINGRLATSSPPCPGILQKFARYGVYLNNDEKLKQFGIGLLSMTVDRIQSLSVDSTYLAVYGISATSGLLAVTPLTPPITLDDRYSPVTPFITRIAGLVHRSAGDVALPLASAAISPTVCMLAPADQPVRVVVNSEDTRRFVASIPAHAPLAGESLLIDTDYVRPGDTTAPQIVWTSWSADSPHLLDVGQPLSITFSEPVRLVGDSPFVLNATSSTEALAAVPVFRDNNRTLTLVPRSPLLMGRSYELRLAGIRDLAGNALADRLPLPFSTFSPYVIQPSPKGTFARRQIQEDLERRGAPLPPSIATLGLRDVDFVTRTSEDSPDGVSTTTVFGVGRGRANQVNLFSIDVTTPERPRALSIIGPSAREFQRLRLFKALPIRPRNGASVPPWTDRKSTVVTEDRSRRICTPADDALIALWQSKQSSKTPGVTFTTTSGCGDLAVATSYNSAYGILHVYDVSDPLNLRQFTQRLLSDNGPSQGFARKNEAPAAFGVPRGFDLLEGLDITHCQLGSGGSICETNANTVGAFVASESTGLELVDIGQNIPEIAAFNRPPQGSVTEELGVYTFPYYLDARVIKGRVYALASDQHDGSGISHLEPFAADLTPGPLLPLDGPAVAMASIENVQLDGDGAPEPHDFIYVAGANGGITVADVSSTGALTAVGRVPMPTAVTRLRDVQVTRDGRFLYASGVWTEAGALRSGLIMIDALRALSAGSDTDGDGWDDRILLRIPITGPGTEVPSGEVLGFRIDDTRHLIYAAIDDDRDGDDETPLAIVRTCQCPDVTVTLTKGGVGPIPGADPSLSFSSDDGNVTTILATLDETSRSVYADFASEIPSGVAVTYHITELPLTGNPADTLVDLSGGAADGTFDGSRIRLTLNPLAGRPQTTRLRIDFRNGSGPVVKSVVVNLAPTFGVIGTAKITSVIDRVNASTCDVADFIPFSLSREARVTLMVDGVVLPRYQAGVAVGLWQDVLLPPGLNQAFITAPLLQARTPGDHRIDLLMKFSDSPEVQAAAIGVLKYEISINETLPVGQTFVKGVGVKDGGLTLQRDDFAIPTGVGPQLSFSRTYSSAGNSSLGAVGAGWHHNWETQLVVDQCSNVTLIGGEGTGTRFVPVGGNYKPQAGRHGTLTFEATTGTWDFLTKQRMKYRYEPQPERTDVYRLAFIEDTFGNRLGLKYSDQRPFLLQSVTDATHRSVAFTYEPHADSTDIPLNAFANIDRVSRVEGPLGLTVEFQYDAFGNLQRAARADRVETYDYKTNEIRDRHNLITVTGPNNAATGGDVTRFTYYSDTEPLPGEIPFEWGRSILVVPDKYELIKTVTEGAGTAVESSFGFAYDYSHVTDVGVRTTFTDARGTRTRYEMNVRGGVTKQTVELPAGDNTTTTRWAYEEGINDIWIFRRTDAKSRSTSYHYDTNGNMTNETIATSDFGDVVTQWTYDPKFSQLLTTTDAVLTVTTNTIDDNTGATLSTIVAPGAGQPAMKKQFSYDPTGLVHTVTDGLGHETTYQAHDTWGNPTAIRDGAGNVLSQTFDERSRLITSADTFGRSTTRTYDFLDRPVHIVKQAGAAPAADFSSADADASYTYLPGGQALTNTDGLGHVRTYAYDGQNRIKSETDKTIDADGGDIALTTTYAYDGNGNKTLETDRRGFEWGRTFDGLNRLLTVTVDGRQTASYTYDAVGNVVTETDVFNSLTQHGYDELYRRAHTVLPVPAFSLNRVYDKVGNVLRESDANGHETIRTFDGARRLVTETDAAGNQKTFSYDAAGNQVETADVTHGLTTRHDSFDGLNRPISTTQEFSDPVTSSPVRYVTGMSYDDLNHTVTTVRPTGAKVVERYNGLDKLAERIVDVGGLNLQYRFRYDANLNLVAQKDPQGDDVDILNTFDGLGRKVQVEYPLGGVEKTYFDGNNNVVRAIRLGAAPNGIETTYTYDVLNRETSKRLVESITKAGAPLAVSTTDYDDAARTRTRRDARGNTTVEEYDPMQRLVRTTDPLGQIAQSEYDGVNRIADVDKRAVRTEVTHDRINRPLVTREFDASGSVRSSTTSSYDDAHNQIVHTDRRGTQHIVQMDGLQRERQVRVSEAGLAGSYGATAFVMEEKAYDGDGNLLTQIDANGNRTQWSYDGADRVTTITYGAGSDVAGTVSYTRDGVGNELTVKDARLTGKSFDQRYAYDARYRRLTSENAVAGVTAYQYDQASNIVAMTEPLGGVTGYKYDEVNKLLEVDETRGGAGGITTYRYDDNRNRVFERDPNGNVTTLKYDQLDRVTDTFRQRAGGVEENATAQHWSYGYDAANNQTVVVDAQQQRTEKSYDYLNRLVNTAYANHKADTTYPKVLASALQLNSNGSIVRVEDRKELGPVQIVTEVTTSAFDPLERMTTTTNYDGKTVSYGYDRVGNRTKVVDADNIATTSAYDSRNRLKAVVAELGAGSGTTSYQYFADGLTRQISYPNGASVQMSYDAADRLTSVANASGALVSQFDYSYDANGNRVVQVESAPGPPPSGVATGTVSYRYDALNRLTEASYPNGATTTYTYAPNGNRLSEVGTDAATGAPVNRQYAYNQLNELLLVTDEANTSQSTQFKYDGNGNTVEERTGEFIEGAIGNPTAVKSFTYDIRDQLIHADVPGDALSFDYDYRGMRTKKASSLFAVRYLYSDRRVLQEYNANGLFTTAKYNYGSNLISMVTAGPTRRSFFYGFDGLFSTTGLTDENGGVASSYLYDAWGRVRKRAETVPNRRLFTGQYLDGESGLYYFAARYYDPSVARFGSADSYTGQLDEPSSRHQYVYAHNRPTIYTDSDGHSATAVGAVAGFFWGFGQMAGSMINDVIAGNTSASTSGYLSTWAQNIIGGAEIGASIDVAAGTGLLASSASGALGTAGFDALTFGGEGQRWSQFAESQVVEGAKGLVLGPIIAKVMPLAGALLKETPVLGAAADWAAGKLERAIAEVGSRYVRTEADALLSGSLSDVATGAAARNVTQATEEGFTVVEIGAGDLKASLELARNGGVRVVAVDPVAPATNAIEQLQSMGGTFVRGRATDLPAQTADHVFQYFPWRISGAGRMAQGGTWALVEDSVRLLKPNTAAHFVSEEWATAEYLASEASKRGLRAVITETTAGAAAPGASGAGVPSYSGALKVWMVNIYK